MSEHFTQTHTDAPTHSWTLEVHDDSSCTIQELADGLADSIVSRYCALCAHHYDAWRVAFAGGPPPSPSSRKALVAFIKPAFGIPSDQKPVDHVEGYVAQALFRLMREQNSEAEDIVKINMPGHAPTDPGGDALIIHRQNDQTLLFRLWEIKKLSGNAHVSAVIGAAYSQLEGSAEEYLARYVVIGQEQADPELSQFYGQLVDLWLEASAQAAAGVSVALSRARVPSRCFTRFGSRFSRFASPVRLRGILTAVTDFSTFAESVKVAIWKGL